MLLSIGDTIRKLQSYTNSSFPIISVYLAIPEGKASNDDLRKRFAKLVDQEIETDKKKFEQDVDYIDAYLQQFANTHKAKGIALFSGGNKVWEVINTSFPIKDKMVIDHSPFLLPILTKLSEYQRYLVVLADREKAKFLTIYLGAVEEQEEFSDDSVPQHVKGDNTESDLAPDKIDRHIIDHLDRHFDLISQKLQEFVNKKPLNGVIVGGHKEILHRLEKHLPKQIQERIIGEFLAEPDISANEALMKTKPILEKADKGYQFQHRSSHFTL